MSQGPQSEGPDESQHVGRQGQPRGDHRGHRPPRDDDAARPDAAPERVLPDGATAQEPVDAEAVGDRDEPDEVVAGTPDAPPADA